MCVCKILRKIPTNSLLYLGSRANGPLTMRVIQFEIRRGRTWRVGRILVGMSTALVSSPVALVATLFGLSSQTTEGTKVLRIVSFGLACPVAIFIGLGVRNRRIGSTASC